jgi:hypothetical protein
MGQQLLSHRKFNTLSVAVAFRKTDVWQKLQVYLLVMIPAELQATQQCNCFAGSRHSLVT